MHCPAVTSPLEEKLGIDMNGFADNIDGIAVAEGELPSLFFLNV